MSHHRIPRRTALRWLATAAVSATALHHFGIDLVAAEALLPSGRGYGTDPDLTKAYKPGELWSLTLKESQRDTAAALADVILPADENGPAASTVGTVDFLDEVVSAPYASHSAYRASLLFGLKWIDDEAKRRYDAEFRDLTEEQKHAICDDICHKPRAKAEFQEAADFFTTFRTLCLVAYYTTPDGMKALGYVGNVPLASFDGPPADLIAKLGLDGV